MMGFDIKQHPHLSKERVCLFLPSLHGGGAEKVMFNLAQGLCKLGLKVDLVLVQAEGAYLKELPDAVRVIDLKASRVLSSLPSLVRYLRNERPIAILSAMDYANVVALLAVKLARISARTIVSVHTNLSMDIAHALSLKTRLTRYWIRPFYHRASAVVAVSQGVADDLVRLISLPPDKVRVIFNPVVTSDFFIKASAPVEHPWFQSGEPPVVLGVGRLTLAKDFSALIRAFAIVRDKRPAHLLILGEGEERDTLEALVKKLGLEGDVALPGFVDNPFCYARASALFVLSSRYEGFGNVLAEAMACNTPVVSVDCPSGPAEILEDGRWGTLVPVGDDALLAEAIHSQLDSVASAEMVESIMERFHEDRIVAQYLDVLIGE
jgi:glycosyltransferase involved in cell wall biosynthesis